MVLAPNDLFSWNNKYSKYTVTSLHLHYSNLFFILQLSMLTLTLCMLVILSRDGVVFFLPHSLPHLSL
jgi:hypothetical protein